MTDQNYSFEEFKSVGGRISPTINLNVHGFNLSAGFTKKYDLSNVVGVKLFFDRQKMVVGFKFITQPQEGMSKIKFEPKQGGATINSKDFLVKFDIEDRSYIGRYEPNEIFSPDGKMFVIQLKNNDSAA